MRTLWFTLLAALTLAGCTPDRTLDSLIPRSALAVVRVGHPGAVAQALGPLGGDLPLKALDGGKPWAATVLPGAAPGFQLVLALGPDGSWEAVQAWARQRGGLDAVRFGTYAVLSSPGLPAPALYGAEQRFDAARLAGGDPVEAYVDVANLAASGLLSGLGALPAAWGQRNLTGLKLALSVREGGLEVRVTTDWRPDSPVAAVLRGAGSPADLAPWTGLLPASGLGLAVSVPRSLLDAAGPLLGDTALSRRWAALAPLIGPRVAVAAAPGPGGWSWSAALESRDPQAFRQAVKTLIASGDLQRHFGQWALDPDTALIYQDRPDAGGVRTIVTLGPNTVQVGYGADRVALAGGPGAVEALAPWSRPALAPAWYAQVPGEAALAATGSLEGLAARASARVLADGNVELRVWADADALKGWQEKFPQAGRPWLSGGASAPRRRTPRRRQGRRPRRACPGS
jgi:hypothetical protein